MITGKEFAAKSFIKSQAPDEQSFIAGWYAREDFDNRKGWPPDVQGVIDLINKKADGIRDYVFELYHDFKIDEADKYMGHNDPKGNILCLLNHIIGEALELAQVRAEDQLLLFWDGS